MTQRKTAQLAPGVKSHLERLTKKLNLKSESDTVAHLIALHEQQSPGLLMVEYLDIRTRAKQIAGRE